MNKRLLILSLISIVFAAAGLALLVGGLSVFVVIAMIVAFVSGLIVIFGFFFSKSKRRALAAFVIAIVGTAVSGVFLGVLAESALFFGYPIDAITPSAATKPVQPQDSVVLTRSKLPAGWAPNATYANYPGSVYLDQTQTKCFVQTTYTTDTLESNSPDVDHQAATVDGIRQKGYDVQSTDATLSIVTAGGERTLPAPLLTLDYNGEKTYQQYGFVSTKDYFVTVTLSCPDQSGLQSARDALQAITFTKL